MEYCFLLMFLWVSQYGSQEKDAKYYFCEVDLPRALSSEELRLKARKFGLGGTSFQNVEKALQSAIEEYTEDDLIFVGGSTFVVADALAVKI